MANIKINETIISSVSITDSGDLLGLNFVTDMNLTQLDNLFTPATSPEFRVVDDAENVVAVYRNRKLITLRVDAGETGNVVNVALQVTHSENEEVELLTVQVNEQADQIKAQSVLIDKQAVTNAEQAAQIAEQANVIKVQEDEINSLKTALTDAEAKITESETALAETQASLTETQTNLAETQAANDMLMECVLEMSEVVYA